MRISDDSTNTQIKAAEDDISSVVLDKSKNFVALLELCCILNVVIDCCVLEALHCVCKNLCLHCYVLESHLAMRVTVAFNDGHQEVRLHLLVNAGKEYNILSRILEHLLTKRTHCMPESIIELHLLRNVFFVRILDLRAKILLQH